MDLEVVRRVAAEDLHRRDEAEQLVHRRVREAGRVAEQLRALLGMLREVQQAQAHRARGRLVAGEQHQDAELAHLEVGQPVTVDLGLEQHADEVVARLRPPLGDQRVDVGLGVAHGLALVGLVEERVREHPLDPVEPARLVLLGQVHEPRERAERHRVRELGHRRRRRRCATIGSSSRVASASSSGPQRLDARLREERVDERRGSACAPAGRARSGAAGTSAAATAG